MVDEFRLTEIDGKIKWKWYSMTSQAETERTIREKLAVLREQSKYILIDDGPPHYYDNIRDLTAKDILELTGMPATTPYYVIHDYLLELLQE